MVEAQAPVAIKNVSDGEDIDLSDDEEIKN